jgi:hypothetical protein
VGGDPVTASLFDYEAHPEEFEELPNAKRIRRAESRRDGAIRAAYDTATARWHREARAFLREYLLTHDVLLAADLWDEGLEDPPGGESARRKIGAVMRWAAKEGLMERCGTAPVPSSNMSPGIVWRSTIYGGPS